MTDGADGDVHGDGLFGLGGRRLLIVEDNEDCAGAVRRWLEICGARVSTAGSVGSALTRVRHEAPDVMLLDVRLPDGTGWDLLQRLRATVPEAADVPVVAMTACRGAAVSEAAQRHGVRHLLTKPIAPAALAEALSDCLES
jgi:CheY-like chemotaxis protein